MDASRALEHILRDARAEEKDHELSDARVYRRTTTGIIGRLPAAGDDASTRSRPGELK